MLHLCWFLEYVAHFGTEVHQISKVNYKKLKAKNNFTAVYLLLSHFMSVFPFFYGVGHAMVLLSQQTEGIHSENETEEE